MTTMTAAHEVRAVLALRAATVRGRRARITVAAGLATVPLLAAGAVLAGMALPDGGRQSAVILMPTAWLGFAILAVVAAATSGTRLLLPRDQSLPFPISPATDALGSLVLAPLNVAWIVQALGLLALTSWGLGPSGDLAGAQLLTCFYIGAVTVVAQTAAWLIEWARTWWLGEWLVRATVVAVLGLGAVLLTRDVTDVLDKAPTTQLVIVAVNSWTDLGSWFGTVGRLMLVALVAHVFSVLLASVLTRRPARGQVRIEARTYPGRADSGGVFAASLRIDAASVWRSPPLRRGLLAMTAVPALVAAAAGLDWYLVVVLPGLVTSGAGLLFGVNALSLDGSGAVWRATLPGNQRSLFVARFVMVAQLCLIGGTTAVVIAGLRATAPATTAEATAVLVALLTTSLQVVAHCARWSVTRPYAASLRDSRDQPAPPAAMAAYSARLALATTGTGLLLSVLARLGLTAAVVAAGAAIGSLAARKLAIALHLWDDPIVRARAISTVASA